MTRRGLVAAALALCATAVVADGGRVWLQQDAGPFAVTVFTSPNPLTAGPADVSVLVQDRASGRPVLDAAVEIRLSAPGADVARRYVAAPGTNRILKAIAVDMAAPGNWAVEVVVRSGGEMARVTGLLPVGPRVSRLLSIWPYLAAPPLVIALFALQAALKRRARGMRPPHPRPLPAAGGEGTMLS
ncbi:MAG TPA: hypothetical protein VGG65_07940 [Thermoanaerobaculia bacterium]